MIKKLQKHTFLIFSCLIVILIFFTYQDYGISWDEPENFQLGNTGLDYYQSLGRNQNYFKFYQVQPEFYLTRGPLFDILASVLGSSRTFYTLTSYHFYIALFSLIAFYFIYRSILLLTNNRFFGFIPVILLLTTPRFWGDVFNNIKDLGPAYILAPIIYFSLKLLKGDRETKNLIFLGMFLGMGVSLRVILIYSYLLLIIFDLFNQRRNIKAFLKSQIIIFIVFFLSVHFFQPYLHTHPILGLWTMLTESSKFPWTGPVLFEGQTFLSTTLPWYYLPKWIAISTPLITLLLGLLGTLVLTFNILKPKQTNIINFYLTSLFFLPIILVIFKKPILYDAWRHLLFLNIPLIILSSIGFIWLIKLKTTLVRTLSVILLLGSIVLTTKEMIAIHPFEYVYFNSLAGGLKGAYGQYETDYWGKSSKEAALWLGQNIKAYFNQKIKVYVCARSLLVFYYLPPNFVSEQDITKADYFICFTRYKSHLLIPDEQTIYEVKRKGVPLTFIKKVPK